MSLARIRQLAAHEVGHTLGFAHNFAASTYGRASVMDYPAPMVEIKDGKLDLSNAYAIGIGAYDKFAIKYAYSQFAAGRERSGGARADPRRRRRAGHALHLRRRRAAAGAAHPLASLWDNGADPVAMLRHEMEVRRIGLSTVRAGQHPAGTPLSVLEAQAPAALPASSLSAAGGGQVGRRRLLHLRRYGPPTDPIPRRSRKSSLPERRREALSAVLATLSPTSCRSPNGSSA